MSAHVFLPRFGLRSRALRLGLAVLLAGCTVGPHYSAPDLRSTAPRAYATTDLAVSQAPPVDRWWIALGDPLLDDMVASALADNPDLATAESRVREARAMARVAGAALYPSLDAGGHVSRDRQSRNNELLSFVPFPVQTTEATDYRVGFDAAWEIDIAGHTRHEVEAAISRFGSAAELRNDALVVVSSEVTAAYVDYRSSSERLVLARSTLADLEETLRLVRMQQEAGVASDEDVRQAEADFLAGASNPPLFEAAIGAALFRLTALTGVARDTLRDRLAPPRPVPAVPAITPVGLPSDVLRRRPDVRGAERDLAAATADVGSAVAAQFPRFSLLGDFGWESVHSGDLVSAASRYWSFGPQLTVPILAGGRLKAQVRAAEAAQAAAFASYRSVVLRAFADVDTALVQYVSEHARAATLAVAASAQAANLTLERRRLAAGDVSELDVLGAERAANRAADQRVQSAGQLALDFAALSKALGGGWESDY